MGTNCNGPVKNNSTSATAEAANKPVKRVRPPAVSLIAVRESAPEIANP